MEFKVVLPDDGYELIITVLGVEMNLEVIKDGKSVKSYEHLTSLMGRRIWIKQYMNSGKE